MGSLGLWLVACTEQLVVRPEGEFSWEPASRLAWPVQGAVLSAFGDAARPGPQGIDLAARAGEPVAAAMLGKVDFVGDIAGYGKVIVLSHADHLSTVYAHLGAEQVREGDTVARGQTIATGGKDGYVHYEIREAKQAVDPAKYYSIAPQPLVASSADVEKKVAREPSGVGVLSGVDEEAPPATATPLRPMATPTRPPTIAPTLAPSPPATATATATATPTLTPRPTATDTPSPMPTRTPTAQPTATPTRTLTAQPTATPTLVPALPNAAVTRTPKLHERALGPAHSARRTVTPPTPTPEPPPAPLPPPAPEPTPATSAQSPSGVALGAMLVGANLFYVPAKLVYAAVGGVTGAVALVLAHDSGVAQDVWKPALGGDFFVTADHLHGNARLRFAGGD